MLGPQVAVVDPMLVALALLSTAFVLLAVVPVAAGVYQYLWIIPSGLATHLEQCQAATPRVSIIIPAWNEAAVIGLTIDRLMLLDYPRDCLRIYVIDDGSSDETPLIAIEKSKEYRGNVFHIRRVAGGEGKAHTLNYGLETLWRSEWTQAVLIMDADVIYTPSSLRKMARHFHDPTIGAVTAYIKEGSAEPNLVQRFITFEYITATGASRRAQNAMGFLACLSGGAQLHSRENLMAIGGEIFCQTLAEDTYTTFRTQLSGRKALFEPNAIVLAEEPDSLLMLWKQRLRWARGNVQVTKDFARLWFRPSKGGLGSFSMASIWFSVFLMPVFQVTATIGLLTLYGIDEAWAWKAFHFLWIGSAAAYLIVTAASAVVDPWSFAKSWWQGIMFPGVVSLGVIIGSLWPPLGALMTCWIPPGWPRSVGVVFLYLWPSLGMVAAYSALLLEQSKRFSRLAAPMLYVAGYGAFLCSVTVGSYYKEWKGASMTWDKTVKTGKIA
ncbi:MAG TPA: glycosyltransferase family 2 protein [Kofleriaceae bacterium]|nr:glycosyltransferase family 2 protein [Kofleriaceae bacterium]